MDEGGVVRTETERLCKEVTKDDAMDDGGLVMV